MTKNGDAKTAYDVKVVFQNAHEVKKRSKRVTLKHLTMQKWFSKIPGGQKGQKTHTLKPVTMFWMFWLNRGVQKRGVREILGGRKRVGNRQKPEKG